jgi:beta-phosphoglucomutase-like phosphatase (HAD superfamily)
MLVEAVICDIDGTLIDSVDLHARAWVDALHEYGHEVAFADVRRQIGKGGDQLLPVFLSKEEIQGLGEDLEKHRSKIFKERYLAGITAFPGVRATYAALTGGRQAADAGLVDQRGRANDLQADCQNRGPDQGGDLV